MTFSLCRHWGFNRRACRRYPAQTRIKVERPVRYLRDNGGTFLNDGDLDQQRRRWLDEIANVRVHGTTGERCTIDSIATSASFAAGRAAALYVAHAR